MNPNWFLRMARLVRHPPGPKQVRLLLIVLAIIAALVLIEHTVGWPEWARVNRLR